MTWKKLEDELPTGKEYAVLLFPINVEAGHMYLVSNPEYARINAIKQGFTHWLEFELAPNHKEIEELFESYEK